jgi:lipoprotein-releasing system ATP-binding protein
MTLLKAHEIHKWFYSPTPMHVLKGISLEVEAGSAIAIMGKSGEGKSTLLHILGTLEEPSSGTLEIAGARTRTANLPKLRNQKIGFIFQAFHLLEEESVLDNVLMPAKIARSDVSDRRALELLAAVGLQERARFQAKLLSGGEKQRASIARALCNNPQIILADEPSGNLDHAHSQEIHALLLRLAKEQGKTLIIATHDRELASLCDKVSVIKDGTLECIS